MIIKNQVEKEKKLTSSVNEKTIIQMIKKYKGLKQKIELFDKENGEELTKLYLKSDVILLTCVFQKFVKASNNDFDINPLYCVNFPGFTWQCGLKNTDKKLQTVKEKDMIRLLENIIRGGMSSVMGDRNVKSDETKKML